MSHPTGIKANPELLHFFSKCKDGNIRILKISIIEETLFLDHYAESSGNWQEDYDLNILPLLEEKMPCYILYKLDSDDNSSDSIWILVTWSPDDSPVRLKMLYASTKASLKTEFGSAYIKQELHASTKDEACLKGYERHKRNMDAPNPLTTSEEEMAELRRTEVNTDIAVDSRHQTIQGLNFPIAQQALQALMHLKNKQVNYVQLNIDLDKESIELSSSEDISLSSLTKCVPVDQARYHLFLFPHSHEGDYIDSIVFIYSMPGYTCSVRERMLFSSCKNPVIETIEKEIGLIIDKKIEIENGSELTESFLLDELHPKQNLHRPKFNKPKGPPNRGPKRLTKPNESST